MGNRQLGAVNFAPLKPRFLEVYSATKTYLPASSGLPPLINYVRRTVDETDPRKVLPIIPRDLESLASVDLQDGYKAMRSNKMVLPFSRASCMLCLLMLFLLLQKLKRLRSSSRPQANTQLPWVLS